jgi:hypothetical protein
MPDLRKIKRFLESLVALNELLVDTLAFVKWPLGLYCDFR